MGVKVNKECGEFFHFINNFQPTKPVWQTEILVELLCNYTGGLNTEHFEVWVFNGSVLEWSVIAIYAPACKQG